VKTTVFHGHQMKIGAYDGYERVIAVEVPTLGAYAVECGDFTPPIDVDSGHRLLSLGSDFAIEADHAKFSSGFSLKFSSIESCRLVIHYHGIRDYKRLFPMITDLQLRARLGQFYEEAERTFEDGSWLAFALMASAVYEGLLGWKLNSPSLNFASLIDAAEKQGLIQSHEARILHAAREQRNLVHASRCETPWVDRADAMDMRTTMDSLLRKLARTVRSGVEHVPLITEHPA
jgi:hypothetical protein